MKKILCLLLSVCFSISAMIIPMSASAGDWYSPSPVEHCVVHDPSLMRANDGRYYIFGSHLVMGESDDLINWHNNAYDIADGCENYFGDWKTELAEPLEWCASYQRVTHDKYDPTRYEELEYNCWANDCIYNPVMGKYCLYGCCSVWGTTASVIWLATSDNVTGPYKYEKSFIYSGITYNMPTDYRYNGLYFMDTNVKTDLIDGGYMTWGQVFYQPWFHEDFGYYLCGWGEYPNAIDPTAYFDKDGNMWLVYGSYSGGCFVVRLDSATGTPDYKYMNETDGYDIYFGKKVSNTNAGTEGTGEGPFIIYDDVSDYYYFFLTYGGLGGFSGYNIREYRSKNPDGPYYDANGKCATDFDNTGLKLIGNYQFACNDTAYLSPGHSSCLIDEDGSMYQAYHTRFAKDNGWGFQTRVHKMARTSDGWAVLLPFEYQGETDTTLKAEDIVGDYEYIDSTNIFHRYGDNSVVEDIILPTQLIKLNADGTISGAMDYDSVVTDANVGAKDVNGTWSLSDDGVNAEFTIGDVHYTGLFTVQKDETAAANNKIVFTAKGDDNSTIWGVHHSLSLVNDLLPTCDKNGEKVYTCSDCGQSMSVTVPSIGHSYDGAVVLPTCTEQGYTNYTCATCGESYADDFVDPIDHIYSTTKATLTKNGTVKCTKCGTVKSTIYYPKTITLSATKYTYDGKVKKPTVKVVGSNGKAISASNYTVTYSNNKNVGKATVKVTFKGNYSGSKTLYFNINPKGTTLSSVSAGSKSFTAKWKKQAIQTTGYQIQYATNSSFKSAKTITVKKNSTTSTKAAKLTAKKKYYVRIRTYKTVNKVNYYSAWSGTKTVTTKK